MQIQEADLRYDLIEEVSKLVDVPLVLHGSSGVTDEDLQKIAKTRFGKVNIGTRLKNVYCDEIRKNINADRSLRDYQTLLMVSSSAVKATVMEKIRLLGSEGKA
jgi:fructose-bisphosphate aldolase class II